MTTKADRHPPIPPLVLAERQLCATLAPRLTRLADDVWVLAQRSPALTADPALVLAADRLLDGQRRLFRREPGYRLLPDSFTPGIALHALAVALRQMQAALAPLVARHAPPPPRSTADEIDDITRLEALILRGIADHVAERNAIPLPPHLRPIKPPPPPPEPGQPPQPRPHIHKAQQRRRNTRRRARRIIGAAA